MSTVNFSHRFFQNRDCKYFPCHSGVSKDEFNCLFCYCPLYMLGKRCGGNFRYNEKGEKTCVDCAFPHHMENYRIIVSKYKDIMEAIRKNDIDD